MQIVYGKGKKSKHGFMPFGNVFMPSGCVVQSGTRLPSVKYMYEESIRFYKRKNTLKAVLRKIQKQNYENGTMIRVPSWFVGYADLYIIV